MAGSSAQPQNPTLISPSSTTKSQPSARILSSPILADTGSKGPVPAYCTRVSVGSSRVQLDPKEIHKDQMEIKDLVSNERKAAENLNSLFTKRPDLSSFSRKIKTGTAK